MNELVETKYVSHPMILAVFQAKRMNQMLGYPAFAPWDFETGHDMDEWLEVADALMEIPSIRARKKQQEQFFNAARRAHPHYAALHKH